MANLGRPLFKVKHLYVNRKLSIPTKTFASDQVRLFLGLILLVKDLRDNARMSGYPIGTKWDRGRALENVVP